MSQNHPVLSVNGLFKKIGDREIVRNITLDVQPGEIYGFLGPNGAGKTTTIRMLVGLIRPTAGSIQIGGFDLHQNFLEAISQVGCIVENPELYPFLSGRENLEHFARMDKRIPPERIDSVVEQVELTGRIDDLVKTYSLGMRQRLGIAQALLGNPKLLILDEPTNGLDPAGIRELRAFIRKLAKEDGISVFISSHILHEVQLMCDRVAIIHEGAVVQTGSLDQLITDQIRVEWRVTPKEKAASILKELSYVENLEITADDQLSCHMPQEQIHSTNLALLESGVVVTGIRPYQPTLEDVFLSMTGGSQLV
ncbi:ABC transporter ATP-binding protein [Risungbinella massiliensis]|uniref:ABC transporter ATP-binding protein n=1 Tax=Risungbinella massiliensis TaxID=1329796 RepID=UPI0005CB8498|nr:ABC transporter ATP-binding protein [Risungbinella massiliensis]